ELLPLSHTIPASRAPTFLPDELIVKPMVAKRKKTARYYLHEMRPKEFRLGVEGGWCYPFSKNLTRQSGYSAGLQATARFSPNLEMWLDAGYYKMRFETDSMYDDIGVPVVTPPSDEFTFIKAEVPVPFLQYSAGMQYLFRAGHKWRPFLGVGYGAVLLLPSEVIYEFQNKALGIEWSFDQEANRREWQTDFLLLRVGFEYELSKHWNWQLRANYRASLGDSKLHTPPLLGIQGGLGYRF
nr:outer membrane beta-barrel protein [Saprospiraceae bacterium]